MLLKAAGSTNRMPEVVTNDCTPNFAATLAAVGFVHRIRSARAVGRNNTNDSCSFRLQRGIFV